MKVNKMTPFGSLVSKALIDRGMTKAQLANMVGTSNQYLSFILHGTKAGHKYRDRIIMALELDASDLNKTVA